MIATMEHMLAMDRVLIYSTFMFSMGLKENIHALKKFHIHNYKTSIIKCFYLNNIFCSLIFVILIF
jgi:hypothetical protein